MIKVVPSLSAVALSLIAVIVAWRVGGGAEAPPDLPRRAPPPADAGARAGDGLEVHLRLVEATSDARFSFPDEPGLRHVLGAHWRRQRPPFVKLSGDAARFVSAVSLRTSANEAQWATSLGGDAGTWAPDVRIWNMNEGSYDQRESLLAPGRGKITFRVPLPAGARLTFAEGTLNATSHATVFVVSVLDARGVRREVHRSALQPADARHWTDVSCDLSAYAGQEVAIELETDVATPNDAGGGGDDGSKGDDRPKGRAVDGGIGVVREEALATPGAAVAVWGNPTILARATPRLPYNVLWIVVDALRPDVIPSFHDDAEDAAKQAAPYPPMEAMLPRIPGLMPALDALAARAVRFTHAYSAASWTRPGTLAMLSGARSSELGIDATAFVPPVQQVNRFYASDPPLLSLALRQRGAATRAFVNNYFIVGYAPIGIDLAFERVVDHRYRTRDTDAITADARRWITENARQRFFAFVNYNSPHEPYEPPGQYLARVTGSPAAPKDEIARRYMAEAAKDDAAIGELLKTLEETGLRDQTIVVVTADHGETMSSAHSGTSGLDKTPIRYHHSVSNFEETTKIPIVIAAPNLAPREVKARVRSTDLAPTVLELLGIEPHPRMSGRSLLALATGASEPDERVVVSEGRGTKAVMHGRYRLLVREGLGRIVIDKDETRETDVELYDLVDDPGERHDLAPQRPDLVAEMRARLGAALENVAVAGASVASEPGRAPVLHLRFAGGDRTRRVSGTIVIGNGKESKPPTCEVKPVELGRETFKARGCEIELALRTSPEVAVGFDLLVDPPGTPVTWTFWLDDRPWPREAVFGGPFGLLAPSLSSGLAGEEARQAAQAFMLPTIDPRRDVGVFVARDRGEAPATSSDPSDEGAEEMARLLREWGYARGKK